MFNYDPLRKIMQRKHISAYKLTSGQIISESTWRRIDKNQSITLNSISHLCDYLHCGINDIVLLEIKKK